MTALAPSPDGRRLFVGGPDGEIECFDPETLEDIHVLSIGRRNAISHLTCSPDGKTLAALTKTGLLHLVRTE